MACVGGELCVGCGVMCWWHGLVACVGGMRWWHALVACVGGMLTVKLGHNFVRSRELYENCIAGFHAVYFVRENCIAALHAVYFVL